MSSEKEQQILDMYKRINIKENEICKWCRLQTAGLSNPVPPWQVGELFDDSTYRVLFVGKNARGGVDNEKSFYDKAFETGDELYANESWAYWSYTKEIATALYGESHWESIAFTNIVKCNNSNTVDTTTAQIKKYCIEELQVFSEELKIIQPKNIIFYTGRYYDREIAEIFGIGENFGEGKLTIGKKQMPWFSKRNISYEGNNVNILRIGHPERLKKEEFCNAVIEWIKGNA